MNDPNRNYQNQNINMNPNQSLDYDQWVNSLGNIQDGLFQNTPLSNSILQNTINNNINMNTMNNNNGNPHFNALNPNSNNNGSINFGNGVGPVAGAVNGNNHNNTNNGNGNGNGFNLSMGDLNLDSFFNSPERFYRDIINESPIVSKTPNFGRTPLKNLNINFSTPNFLKNIDSTQQSTATKNHTPLKNQLFNSKIEIFETPKLNKQNSTTLNSSPTTIKISSSAIKPEDNATSNKMIPPSPTPTSKINSTHNSIKPVVNVPPPSIPKMGCFKKTPESKPSSVISSSNNNKRSNNGNNKFQIIMTDVNTFANNSKNPKPKKKKLARSSTSVNTSTNSITKKNSLKRSLSQPQGSKVIKSLTPTSNDKKISKQIPQEFDESSISFMDNTSINSTANSSGNSDVSSLIGSSKNSESTNNNINDLFDDEKILSDTEKLLEGGKYF